MNESPLSKSRLALDVKRIYLQSKKKSKETLELFHDKLTFVAGEAFHLIEFEVGNAYKFDMIHNANAAIGYLKGNNRPNRISVSSFKLYLESMAINYADHVVLIYSNYPKSLPFVITNLGIFIDNFEVFSELMENDISIVSQDLSQYLSINFDDLNSLDCVEVFSIGEIYRMHD
jgi:hypothetical protein